MGKFYNIIVIGAGPSGIMAAITAAKNRKRVLLVDHNDKVAKKIYATGNGRCNFTNENMNLAFFHGNKELVETILSQFTERECIHFFHELGILPKSKNGYVYPNSEQASSVAKAFERELFSVGVDVGLLANIESIEKRKNDFSIIIDGEEFRSSKLIIATGLKAAPGLGSDGSFIEFIKGLGHSIQPVLPALCPFYCDGIDFKSVSKMRQEGLLSLYINDQLIEENYGEIQFTDYGLSGIPVFQLSSNISKALYKKEKVQIAINLLPEFDREELLAELKYRALMLDEEGILEDVWNGLLVDKLCEPLLNRVGLMAQQKVVDMKNEDYESLCDAISNTIVTVTKARDYEFAQVCTGGVTTEELNIRTLESLIVPNLYFAGEVLDVDGICGGYNLQWAFSSGYVAGDYSSR